MRRIVLAGMLLVILPVVLPSCLSPDSLPSLDATFGRAEAKSSGRFLTVSTGAVQRTWQWDGRGFATVSFKNLDTGKEWCTARKLHTSDWMIPGLVTGDAKLVSLRSDIQDDQGFTSRHLCITAEIEYPASGKKLRYAIWAYPDAPGFRTQISVKALHPEGKPQQERGDTFTGPEQSPGISGLGDQEEDSLDREGIVELLPVVPEGMRMTAWGYGEGTQWLNSRATTVLKEHTIGLVPPEGEIQWASGLNISQGDEHLILVKESNKCYNTGFAANNGRFSWDGNSIYNTGTGWLPGEMGAGDYRSCWAAWSILAHGDAVNAQLALKRFDRFRYPVDPDRDIYIIANTWGSSVEKTDSRLAARESNIFREIESAADLGIDIQQVDDGWQGMIYSEWKEYESGNVIWRPADSVTAPAGSPAAREFGNTRIPLYPNGWDNIREYASQKGVKLGLWVYGRSVALEDLLWNHEHGGFVVFKYDFFTMDPMDHAQHHLEKIRRFILATGHKVRTNWDVTGRARTGYYVGRDLGAIYLENRKTASPPNVIYKPYLVLRDAWQVARYVNLNKFEITLQNVDRVTRKTDAYSEVSDAWKHPHDYCFAQTMMGTPIFFQETQLYTPEARAHLKPLIRIYRQHRADLYAGYPFPIGDEPDNKSWSGFQNYNPSSGVSYLTLFRQIGNKEDEKDLEILFYEPGTRLRWTNLETGKAGEVTPGTDRKLKFRIPEAPGYRFLQLKKIDCQ